LNQGHIYTLTDQATKRAADLQYVANSQNYVQKTEKETTCT